MWVQEDEDIVRTGISHQHLWRLYLFTCTIGVGAEGDSLWGQDGIDTECNFYGTEDSQSFRSRCFILGGTAISVEIDAEAVTEGVLLYESFELAHVALDDLNLYSLDMTSPSTWRGSGKDLSS